MNLSGMSAGDTAWIIAATALVLAGCRGWQSATDPQGPQASQLNALIWLFVIVAAMIWALVMLVLVAALWRRSRPPEPHEHRTAWFVGGAMAAVEGRAMLLRDEAGEGDDAAAPYGEIVVSAAEPLTEPEWSLYPGAVTPVLQTPSKYERNVVRALLKPKGEPRTQHARTPHQMLNGTITPNALHFTILHSGIPDIDPEQHRLVIHGMVRQPLVFTLEQLERYPRESRIAFIECAGNSQALNAPVRTKLLESGDHGAGHV